MLNTNFILYDLVLKGIENNKRFITADKINHQWHQCSHETFIHTIKCLTLALHDMGVKKGDKVAIHSENRSEWLISDLAITAMGAITIPIYTTQSQDQIDYIIKHSDARVLIVSNQSFAEKYTHFCQDNQFIGCLSFEQTTLSNFQFFSECIEAGDVKLQQNLDLFTQLKSDVTPDDIVTIGYTSGTTGTPKGVMLTHRNLAHAIQAPLEKSFLADHLNIDQDTVLSFLPFTHVFEHCVIYGYLTLGVPVYIVSDLEYLQDMLSETKPAHFSTVPRLLEKIYQGIHLKIRNQKGIAGFLARQALQATDSYELGTKPSYLYWLYDCLVFKKIREKLGGKLRGITSGGAALSPKIMLFFNAIGIRVGQGYGLTETAPGLTLYDKDNLKLATAGYPLEGVRLKIAEDGEILAQGENIMLGYYNEPEKTNEVIDQDGWFHTGDIGHLDQDGFLYITDRKKELLKLSTGKYIAPAPLENKLLTIAGVDQAVIVGDGEKYCGALIIPTHHQCDDKFHALLEQEIDKINQTVAPWETIKKFVISRQEMSIESGELTPTMKKKRRIILEKRSDDIKKLFS